MKTYLDCIPCFFKQALEAARFVKASNATKKRILNELSDAVHDLSLDASPPEMGNAIYGLVARLTNKRDPFKKVKHNSNRVALGIYEKLKRKVSHSRDRLLTAVELAIAGNIIDYGVKNSLDVEKEIKKILKREQRAIRKEGKGLFNYSKFRRSLKKSGNILYIGDNAGEAVFDRILIEEIRNLYKDMRFIYAVKERPIINDVLAEDAYQCGIDSVAEVESTGLDIPGTVLKLCSKKFLRRYRDADMVISKGQGNFEALSEDVGNKKPTFFLFMAKCAVVAGHVGCNLGDIILLCYNRASLKCRP